MGKEFSVLIAGRAAQVLITIASFRMLTSLLPPAEVGNYFLVLSIVGFFSLTLVSPFGMFINRRFHKWEKDGSLMRKLGTGSLYLGAVSVFSALATLVLSRFFGVGATIPAAGFMLMVGGYTFLATSNQTVIPALNMLSRRGAFVLFSLATLGTGLLFSSLFALYLSKTAVAWLSGQALALGLLGGAGLLYLKRKVSPGDGGAVLPPTIAAASLKPILAFVWPLAITYFFMWGQNMSHRLIIERSIGPEFLGIIGVGFGIAAGMSSAVESVAQQFFLPLFYKEISSSDQAAREVAWNKMARLTLPLYLSFAIMVSCTAPFILKLLAGAKFNHAFLFLVCGAWFEFFRMTTNILASVAHSEMRTAHLIKSYLTGALIVAGGTIYAVRRPDYEVLIPAVLVLSGLAMACVMSFDMKKLMRFKVLTKELGESFLLSLPFAAAALFYGFRENLWASGAVCGCAGIYFLWSQYAVLRRARAAAAPAPVAAPAWQQSAPAGDTPLTVAIPTYNGSASLARALESVLAQAGPGVEVLVSDNCSTDSVPELVQGLARRHACLKYFRNETNVGYDRNVDLAMRRASGDFVWLLGDDDVILPGGVAAVLAAIKAAPGSGAIYADCPHSIELQKDAGGVCRNGDEYFDRTRFKSGFISTNVFNRRLWASLDLSRYFGGGWIHIGYLVEALPLAPSYVVNFHCADYIRDLTGGMRWGGDGSFIHTGLRLARLYQRMAVLPYSRRTRRRAFWSIKGAYWRNICLAKAKGFRTDLAVLKECMSLYKGFASFWLLDLPIFLLPGVIFRTLFKAWKSPLFRKLDRSRRRG